MRFSFSGALCLILILLPQVAASEVDLSNVRAVHMGGNWGATRIYRDYEDDVASENYIQWLKSINANWVGISVALQVTSSDDSNVRPRYHNDPNWTAIPTFTDDELTQIIQRLKNNGFHVYLTLSFEIERDLPEKPVERGYLGTPQAYEWLPEVDWADWPWALDHPNHDTFVSEFWQSYTEQAVHFATLAESLGVELFSLGTETEGLFRTRSDENHPNHYKNELQGMVSAVRNVYSGLLSYDMIFFAVGDAEADFGEGTRWLWQDVGFDVIGISSYFALTDTEPKLKLSFEQLKSGFEQVFDNFLKPLQERNPGLPIMFLEFGYVDSIRSPYIAYLDTFTERIFIDEDENGLDDGAETQADAYRAMFEVNEAAGRLVKGAFLWEHDWASGQHWDELWGPIRHFGMRDKLAEDVITSVYGNWVGSLSGTITDFSDGSTPVHPVVISLMDPVTGADVPDLFVLNMPDGSYEIPDIPPGNYKVIFNAVGDANAYIDELHNDIPCDNGGCAINVFGDVVVIGTGPSNLDAQLRRGFLISGTVTDESARPIPSVILDVFDQWGNPVCCGGTSDNSGYWSMAVDSVGDYYIQTAGHSAPDYFAEIWDNKLCDGCDPVTTGDQVNVVDSDIVGIDFQLKLNQQK